MVLTKAGTFSSVPLIRGTWTSENKYSIKIEFKKYGNVSLADSLMMISSYHRTKY